MRNLIKRTTNEWFKLLFETKDMIKEQKVNTEMRRYYHGK